MSVIELFKKNDKISVFAVVKINDGFNYYSSFNSQIGGEVSESKVGDVSDLRIGEIVGWRNAQQSLKLIMRMGVGQQWGFNGFIDM
jgi:hypothetical protein